jgi:isopropylmalate/homocitrate/citramalate synthase
MIERSSRADFNQRLDGRHIDLGPTAFEEAFARMQRVADLTGEVSDIQMQAIVDEVVSGTETLRGVAESFR